MRQFIALLWLLLAAAPCFAEQNTYILGISSSVCTTATEGSTLNEGFPATPNNTWTSVAPAGSTITYGHALQAGYEITYCGDGVRIADPVDGSETGIYINMGALSAQNITVCAKDMYFNDIGLMVASGDTVDILNVDSDTTWSTEGIGKLELVNVSGTIYFRANGFNTTNSTTAVAENTFYDVCLVMDTTGAVNGSSITVNGTSEGLFQSNGGVNAIPIARPDKWSSH